MWHDNICPISTVSSAMLKYSSGAPNSYIYIYIYIYAICSKILCLNMEKGWKIKCSFQKYQDH